MKYRLQLQDKSCNQYEEITDIIKCRYCLDPNASEEECLFKDFRAFRVVKKELMFGFYFPDAIQERSPLSHTSKRFNRKKPYNTTDLIYLKSKLRSILKATIDQDQPAMHHRAKSQSVLLRKDFEGYRHVCDICLTSIFNYHYVCLGCTVDICSECYKRWGQVKKDPKKSECHGGLMHKPQIFQLCQKYSSEDVDAVMKELDSEDCFVDEINREAEANIKMIKKTQPVESLVLPLSPESLDQLAVDLESSASSSSSSASLTSICITPSTNDDDNKANHQENVSSHENTNTNKYAHLENVTMTEETSFSLPTTITNAATLNLQTFQQIWTEKNPLLVENCLEKTKLSWNPKYFGDTYAEQEIEVIDCKDNSKHLSTAKEFFGSYESEEKLAEYCEKLGTSRVIKIKDWPPKSDFKEIFHDLYDDYMNNVLPVPAYCSEGGFFNISNRLPEEYMPPDLGPKMFISQASDPTIKSRTKLHCDMADAINVMCHSSTDSTAAVWHIFASKDLIRLRAFVHRLNKKRDRNHGFDPILSESSYLDEADLAELEKETGIKPFLFHQKVGDAVFIPAGCAHQVQNIAGSIKCAYDFLSPETMQESSLVTSHFQSIKLEDKLQLKTTLLYAWKSLLT